MSGNIIKAEAHDEKLSIYNKCRYYFSYYSLKVQKLSLKCKCHRLIAYVCTFTQIVYASGVCSNTSLQ